VTGYVVENLGSISGRNKSFFPFNCVHTCSEDPPTIVFNGYRRAVSPFVKLTTRIQLFPRAIMVDLYLHSATDIMAQVGNNYAEEQLYFYLIRKKFLDVISYLSMWHGFE
jgi:hypothetical protein